MMNFGNVMVETAVDQAKFCALIAALNLKPPVLIKPNWGTVECYTEADILDWTLSAIPGEKIVIESHGWARSEEILLGKKPAAFTKANLRIGDEWFREYTGIQKVLAKHQVEYLNLTEEVWAERTADCGAIQQAVETRYAPVQAAELYARVPQRLYALRGGSLLSLAKLKLVFYPLGVSMSIKNLFGLIARPSRGKYHGPDHTNLDQSIVDINKIYHSLFAVSGVVETVHSTAHHVVESERSRVFPGSGIALASTDTITLDAVTSVLARRDPETVGHLRLSAQTFGDWDRQSVAEAARSGVAAAAGMVI